MKTFNVTCEPYFYSSIFVNANNVNEAMEKANKMGLNNILSKLNLTNLFHVKDHAFNIKDIKADYAEPTGDENFFEVSLTITYTSSSPISIEAEDEDEACCNIEDMFVEESGNIDLDTDEDIYFEFVIDGKLYCENDDEF